MTAPPFFIVGCGRSGTSLLRDLLNAHSRVAVPLESLFIVDYLRAGHRLPRNEMIELLVREPEIREWGLPVSRSDLREFRTPVEAVAGLHSLYARQNGKERWGQKTPRFVRHLDLLGESFPGARFVHLVRDPRAVVSSLVHSDVHCSNAWHAAHRWVRDAGAGAAFEERHPQQVLRIRYEELVRHPEETLRRVTAFLDLDFEPAMLERRSGRAEYSPFYAGIHRNLDRPPTAEFVDRWTGRLNPAELSVVAEVTGELAGSLGYETGDAAGAGTTTGHWRLRTSRLPGLVRQAHRYAVYRRAYLVHLIRRKRRLGLLGEFLCAINY